MREIMHLAKQIRDKKIIMKEESRIIKASTKPIMPRTAAAKVRDRSVAKLKEQMEDLGVDMEDTNNVSVMHKIPYDICMDILLYLIIIYNYYTYNVMYINNNIHYCFKCDQAHFKRARSRSRSEPAAKRMRMETQSRARSVSKPPRDEMGVKNETVSLEKMYFFFNVYVMSYLKKN